MTLSNFEGGVDAAEFECKAKVDRVATTGTAWLGLTVGCAECHTHKFDPISQREFYQLYAFFNAAEEADVPTSNPTARAKFDQARKQWELEKARLEAEREAYRKSGLEVKQIEWERSVKRSSLTNTIAEMLGVPAEQRTTAQRRELWEDFVASRKDKPYPRPDVGPEGEGADKQRMLEEKYFPAEMLNKYKK